MRILTRLILLTILITSCSNDQRTVRSKSSLNLTGVWDNLVLSCDDQPNTNQNVITVTSNTISYSNDFGSGCVGLVSLNYESKRISETQSNLIFSNVQITCNEFLCGGSCDLPTPESAQALSINEDKSKVILINKFPISAPISTCVNSLTKQ